MVLRKKLTCKQMMFALPGNAPCCTVVMERVSAPIGSRDGFRR